MKSPAILVVAVALAFQLPAVVNADCLPSSEASCQGSSGGWNPGACVSIGGPNYCCCGGESGVYCSSESDCPATPTPTPTPPPANCGTSCTGCTSCSACWAEGPCYWHPDAETKCQVQSSSYRCSDPVTTPEPTSPLTSAPTTPSRCTEANTCEVESSSECKTCSTGSSSNSLCESYNVNYESWYCTWCDCSTGPSSPATPTPAPSLPSGTFTHDCTSPTTSSCKQTLAFGTGLQWDASEPVTMALDF